MPLTIAYTEYDENIVKYLPKFKPTQVIHIMSVSNRSVEFIRSTGAKGQAYTRVYRVEVLVCLG